MGTRVALVLRDGDEITPRARDALLYDVSGTHWPSCSLLIAPFEKMRAVAENPTSEALAFYGRSATIRQGAINLPPRAVGAWDRLGAIETIFYERRGKRAPGYFRHEFNRPRGLWKLVWPVKKGADKPAILYTLRGAYRVELPQGCIVDDRGIVVP
jgi:hypothetical protein